MKYFILVLNVEFPISYETGSNAFKFQQYYFFQLFSVTKIVQLRGKTHSRFLLMMHGFNNNFFTEDKSAQNATHSMHIYDTITKHITLYMYVVNHGVCKPK